MSQSEVVLLADVHFRDTNGQGRSWFSDSGGPTVGFVSPHDEGRYLLFIITTDDSDIRHHLRLESGHPPSLYRFISDAHVPDEHDGGCHYHEWK